MFYIWLSHHCYMQSFRYWFNTNLSITLATHLLLWCVCPVWLYTMACFMWSPIVWSLNGDHIASSTFLYKIVPSINLQKVHQIKIKFIVCNKNNNKLVFIPSVGYLTGHLDSSDIPMQKPLMCSPQTDWTLVYSFYITWSLDLWSLMGDHSFLKLWRKYSIKYVANPIVEIISIVPLLWFIISFSYS